MTPYHFQFEIFDNCPDFEKDCLALFDETCSVDIDERYSLILFQPTVKTQDEKHFLVTDFSEVTKAGSLFSVE